MYKLKRSLCLPSKQPVLLHVRSYGRAIIIVNDDMKEGEENAPSQMIFRCYEMAGIVFQNVGYSFL